MPLQIAGVGQQQVGEGRHLAVEGIAHHEKGDAVTTVLALVAQHLTDGARDALAALATRLQTVSWDKASLNAAIKETCTEKGLKMPQVAIPLRVKRLGVAQAPSTDAVLDVLGRARVLSRLS